MYLTKRMSEMSIGERGIVCKTGHTGVMKKRLTELGLIEGTETECVMRSSHGDMAAFIVRGACIALRDFDLMPIYVNILK